MAETKDVPEKAKEEATSKAPKPATKAKLDLPDLKELLKAGVQFGHETRRWDPKMAKYIFGAKNNIHIIDVTQTVELLEVAAQQLHKLAQTGDVLFIGTKRQASSYVKSAAIDSGSYYSVNRWVGGFFTNFSQVKTSLKRLRNLEEMFEKGIEGRTKYEVSRMKVEWQRLNRLYEGVKDMDKAPVAAVVVDPRFEAAAVKECRLAGIPVFALTDTNCNPEKVDYVIPGNDDALRSIELIVNTLGGAVKKANAGKGVKHNIKDYSRVEVKIIKSVVVEREEAEEKLKVSTTTDEPRPQTRRSSGGKEKPVTKKKSTTKKVKSDSDLEGGILGRSRESK